MWAPTLDGTEALKVEVGHFLDCIERGERPRTDGEVGLRVVQNSGGGPDEYQSRWKASSRMSDMRCQRIAPDVKLGQNVTIYDFVNLYGCEIGDETKVGTFVEIQKGSTYRA